MDKRTFKPLLKRLFWRIQEDNVFGRAAQLSYYFLLALFPLLLFLVSLLGFLAQAGSDLRNKLVSYLAANSDHCGSHDRSVWRHDSRRNRESIRVQLCVQMVVAGSPMADCSDIRFGHIQSYLQLRAEAPSQPAKTADAGRVRRRWALVIGIIWLSDIPPLFQQLQRYLWLSGRTNHPDALVLFHWCCYPHRRRD